MTLSNLNETEKINAVNGIATSLSDLTSPENQVVFAQELDLAVNIVKSLNK